MKHVPLATDEAGLDTRAYCILAADIAVAQSYSSSYSTPSHLRTVLEPPDETVRQQSCNRAATELQQLTQHVFILVYCSSSTPDETVMNYSAASALRALIFFAFFSSKPEVY